ncbi:MAG: TonB family protein [Nitrospinota bacterium]|nr:TonB family protein [Nitrospinota bacterium]
MTIGLPSKGRLKEGSISFFKKNNLKLTSNGGERNYFAQIENFPNIKIIYLHAKEIIQRLGDGTLDIGISGLDLLSESRINLQKKIEIKKINTNVRQKAKAGFSRKSPHKPVNYRDNFAPKADSTILKTALPGPLPPPTQVTSKDRENKKHRFYDLVLGKIEQAKVYPKIAKKMQIEGEVPLSFKIYPDGTVGEINILTSARNHKLLKRAAMTTIQKASPYTPIPSDLRKEKGLKFKVKISYKLN